MDTVGDRVAGHYSRGGALLGLIEDGLRAMGRPLEGLDPDDLAGVDEFHMGGRPATERVAAALGPMAGWRVLDVGCGIGGPARYLARHHGCRVTGIDLTPEFVETAEALTRMTGLSDRVGFRLGDGGFLPFKKAEFDAATLLHVGMNVADKPALFAEVARVVRPGGGFAVYDAMRVGPGDFAFPVPWARTAETSFVASPDDYRRDLDAAGFEVAAEEDLRGPAIEMFGRMSARLAAGEPLPPLNLPLLIGPEAPTMLGNLVAALKAGQVAPVLMVCRRR